jgi:hypothetical protein
MAWVQEIYDTLYDPNTICVACISHGKDSLAMLRAIKLLGLPLHRIVTSDVWATQDIPADLPPMWEWKKEADKIIKELYGIEVEHICAMQKEKYPISDERKKTVEEHAFDDLSQFVQVERERERERESTERSANATRPCSTPLFAIEESTQETSKDFRQRSASGAKSSNLRKLTYEDIFYRQYAQREQIYGFPFQTFMGGWCRRLKRTTFQTAPGMRGAK